MSRNISNRQQNTANKWNDDNCDRSKMFQCTTGRQCIYKRYVCDGKADCKDQSDEHLYK
jgi:hypothetical protein